MNIIVQLGSLHLTGNGFKELLKCELTGPIKLIEYRPHGMSQHIRMLY